MKCIQLNIQANQYQQEELIALLSDYDPAGFEEKENELVAYFDAAAYEEPSVKKILEGYDFKEEILVEQNWNAVWERNFQPVVVDHFCAVRADFHPPVPGVAYDIVITPKMSFGTGHHATTYMMMEQMQHLDFRDKNVLDFGTGTGILAILAEKLGAASITATDIDEWSFENAQENRARNQCGRITVARTPDLPEGSFQVILANINRNVILEYLPRLKQILHPDGQLLLSGLLAHDEPDIVQACTAQALELVKQTERNSWISLLFVNRK